jgi:hypothetical protein
MGLTITVLVATLLLNGGVDLALPVASGFHNSGISIRNRFASFARLSPPRALIDTIKSPNLQARRRRSSQESVTVPVAPVLLSMTSAGGADGDALNGALAFLAQADPAMEAQVLTDLAHVSLDLVTLLGPATVLIRMAAVFGRVFAMAADYVPDHAFLPGELLFQSFMLAIACVGLVQASMPMALSTIFCSDISLGDGKAYATLFRPAGLTWEQYKALTVYSLDWVTVPPGTVIDTSEQQRTPTRTNRGDDDTTKDHSWNDSDNDDTNNDYVYWLYSGTVSVTSQNRELYKVCSTQTKPPAARLWGESKLFQQQKKKKKKLQQHLSFLLSQQFQRSFHNNDYNDSGTTTTTAPTTYSTHNNDNNNDSHSFPPTTVTAGASGATLIRLHTRKLSVIMDSDPALKEAMRTLVFQGMQAKLAVQLAVVEE